MIYTNLISHPDSLWQLRNVDSIAIQTAIQDDWLDRLITSMYIVLTGTLFTISLAIVLGLNS